MQSTQEYYEELAEKGRAERKRIKESEVIVGTYKNPRAVMFSFDVEAHGFQNAMHMAMDTNTRIAHEAMGTPISYKDSYRRTAGLRLLRKSGAIQDESDYQRELNHYLCSAAEDDEWYHDMPAKYDGHWMESGFDEDGNFEVEVHPKVVVEPLGWQQG